MQYRVLGIIKIILLYVIFLHDVHAKIPTGNVTRIPEFVGGIKPEAVWTGADINNQLEEKCGGNETCTAHTLQELHASQQAIAFSRWKAGLITNYKKYNNLYTFTAWLPGSRLKEGVFIGNNQGMIFEVDNWLEKHKPFHNSRRNQIDTRYGCQFPPWVKLISKSQQRLVYDYPLVGLSGTISGHARVAFDFDKAGNFIKASFI